MSLFDPAHLDLLEQGYQQHLAQRAPVPQAPAKKPGNFFTHLLPTVGGIGGGVGGGALGGAAAGTAVLPGIGTVAGGLIGALLGGAAGGAGGKVLENKVEHQALGNGVAGQAIEQGVLSAGPLRLLKGAKAAGAVAAAAPKTATLADALNAAGDAAAAPGLISRTLSKVKTGDKLQSGSDQLATHALKLNGSQFNTDFANKTGEEVGQFATRFGLVGKTPEQIRTLIQNPGQKLYAQGVQSIGTIPKADVIATIKNDLADKINSPFREDKVFAQSVVKQARAILKPYGTHIPATELNNLKTAAYKKVNNKFVDKSGVESNQLYDTLSNAFRNAVGNAADKAGLTIDPAVLKAAGLPFKSTKLSDLGHELRNLDEITKQIDVKSRVGKGKNILGLGGLSGATAGGVLGGVPGAAIGLGTQAVLKNPRVLAGATNALDSVGGKLANGAASAATNTFKPRVVAPALNGLFGAASGSNDLAGALMNAHQPDISSGNNSAATSTANQNSNIPNMDASYNNGGDMSSAGGQSPYSLEAMNADIAADPKNASKYFDLYNNYQKAYASGGKSTFNSAIAGHISDTQKGLQTLDQLKQLVQSPGYAGGKIEGNLRKLNPFDNTFNSQQAVIDASRQIVGKALEGGVLRKEDEAKYIKILPTLQDNPEVALNKINFIQQSIQQALHQYQGLVGDGSGQQDLTSALMQAGYSGQ